MDLQNLEQRIDELLPNLPVRVKNCLKNEGIFLVGHLLSAKTEELLKAPNFSTGSLNKLKVRLGETGYRLEALIGHPLGVDLNEARNNFNYDKINNGWSNAYLERETRNYLQKSKMRKILNKRLHK